MKMERLPQIPQCIDYYNYLCCFELFLCVLQKTKKVSAFYSADNLFESSESKKEEGILNIMIKFSLPLSSFHSVLCPSHLLTSTFSPYSHLRLTSLHTSLKVNAMKKTSLWQEWMEDNSLFARINVEGNIKKQPKKYKCKSYS